MPKQHRDQFSKNPDQEIRRENLECKLQNLRNDLEPKVVRYYLKQKNSHQLFSPVHNVQYTKNTRKTCVLYNSLQKVTVEPTLSIDEINEQKWDILSKNCIELLEISRQKVGKPPQKYVQQQQQQSRKRFLSKRQSIELRLGEMSSPVSVSAVPQPQVEDPLLAKFKKFYNKIGLPNQDSFKPLTASPLQKRRLPLRKHSSLHVTPSSIFPTKNNNYLQELLKISNVALNFQMSMKKDKSEDLLKVGQKVSFIKGEFNKFHDLLQEQDSF